MTDRRSFLRYAAGAVATAGVDAFAQPAERQYRVGVLRPTGAPRAPDPVQTEIQLPRMLAQMGYVEGRNLSFELRYAAGDLKRLPAMARELVEMRMDVIVAAARETSITPAVPSKKTHLPTIVRRSGRGGTSEQEEEVKYLPSW